MSKTTEKVLKSKGFKILQPVIIVALAIALWRNGYEFGQWLQSMVHK